MANLDRDEQDDGPGLIDLDMGAFGSGTMNDPLRHAMGMRNAQDQCKMRMWNSFPSLFQNTIFHGEQDPEIKALRHAGTLAARLERARELKESGNQALKAASASSSTGTAAESSAQPEASQEEQRLTKKVVEVESAIGIKQQELAALRRELKELRSELEREQGKNAEVIPANLPPGAYTESEYEAGLKNAITSYEKSAGILRYVECTRPDWKNDDGSYKGIEDVHLRVDEDALVGEGAEVQAARDVVTSCYLNIALANQKLGKFDEMRQACDEVIRNVNPNSVKALYRRAQARIAPLGALDADRDAAIQDLHTAAQIAPQDKEVRALLEKLRVERRVKQTSERNTFAGLFDRGSVVTNDPRAEGDKPPELDLNDPKVQAMLDIRPGPGSKLF